MRKLIGDELKEDAKKYGDDRRCPINAKPPASALEAAEIIPAEPITVVLSKAGWVRAGKGHEIDPLSLSYKSGDEFSLAVQGKTVQRCWCCWTTRAAATRSTHASCPRPARRASR